MGPEVLAPVFIIPASGTRAAGRGAQTLRGPHRSLGRGRGEPAGVPGRMRVGTACCSLTQGGPVPDRPHPSSCCPSNPRQTGQTGTAMEAKPLDEHRGRAGQNWSSEGFGKSVFQLPSPRGSSTQKLTIQHQAGEGPPSVPPTPQAPGTGPRAVPRRGSRAPGSQVLLCTPQAGSRGDPGREGGGFHSWAWARAATTRRRALLGAELPAGLEVSPELQMAWTARHPWAQQAHPATSCGHGGPGNPPLKAPPPRGI